MTGARRSRLYMLAIGVVALEFAAAVQTFVASTLLPVISADLNARTHTALLVGSSSIGLFAALPFAQHAVARLGVQSLLAAAVAGYLAGVILSTTATEVFQFAAGQALAGFSSGLLAVFGVAAVIEHMHETLRVKVMAANSSMWIVPALVGPLATLALNHLVGWRWTLLLPVPFVLAGRVMVGKVALPQPPAGRPLATTLLVPFGAALVAVADTHVYVTVPGVVLALWGVRKLLPAGSFRLQRGVPAATFALLLFATGYFGADSLITLLLTHGYDASLTKSAIVLSAGPLAWSLTSLLLPMITKRRGTRVPTVLGLSLAAAGTAALALFEPAEYLPGAVVGWIVAGVGVGIAYPGLYLLASSADAGSDASVLATGVITAEAFGNLFGRSIGATVLSGTDRPSLVYSLFAVALFSSTGVALRATR